MKPTLRFCLVQIHERLSIRAATAAFAPLIPDAGHRNRIRITSEEESTG